MEPPSPSPSDPDGLNEVTLLLERVRDGDDAAADVLLPLVYEQLRATAGNYFRLQHANHTLQPTALVHEAYVKLVGSSSDGWSSRGHFCAVAATAMRQILHDHARSKAAAKRSRDGAAVPATYIETPSSTDAIDIIALDEALTALRKNDERGARIVEMRFFGGLTNEQVADLLDVSRPTVERAWRRCRAWLRAHMAGPDQDENDEA